MRAGATNWADGLAITLSAACVAHCLALPVLIALLPALTHWLQLPEAFHAWMLACALPVSLAVLGKAAQRRPAARRTFALGLAGLLAMGAALFVPSEAGETAMTLFGATMLASAHVQNWRRRTRCHAK